MSQKFLWVLGLPLLGCGMQTAATSETSLGTERSALASAGTLAFSDVWSFHTRVGLDQPDTSGYVNITWPKAQAALAGTGLGDQFTRAQLQLDFQLTSLDPTWNNDSYGPARRVCAAAGGHEYCWYASGVCEVTLNGSVEYSATCPALETTSSFQITMVATKSFTGVQQNVFSFVKSGTVVAGRFKTEAWAGDANTSLRVERATARVKLQGLATGTGTLLAAAHTEGPAGTRMPAAGTTQTLSNLVVSGAKATYTVPPNLTSVLAYRDGYLLNTTAAGSGGTFTTQVETIGEYTLPSLHYSFQLVTVDGQGVRSSILPTSLTTPARPQAKMLQTGQLRVGLVMAFIEGAPGLVNGLPPQPVQEMSDGVLTRPGSPAIAFQEITRGHVSVTGRAFGWMKLRKFGEPLQPPTQMSCGTATPDGFMANCTDSNSAIKQALAEFSESQVGAANAFRASDYDVTYALVYGDNEQNNFHAPGHRPVSTGLFLHELFGHDLGLFHAGGLFYDCRSGGQSFTLVGLYPGPDLGNAAVGGGCASGSVGGYSGGPTGASTYADDFEPMGVAAAHYYHTMNLDRLGLLRAGEVKKDYFGGAYSLTRWQHDEVTTKQLRVMLEDNWFYFLEYRPGEGFDGAPGCQVAACQPYTQAGAAACFANGCNPLVANSAWKVAGLHIRLWRGNRDVGEPTTDGAETQLLTPGPLANGQSWCDPIRGIRVTRVSSNADTAQVQIDRGPCTP